MAVKRSKDYFSLNQLKAIRMLAEGEMTGAAIASEIGVNPNSIYRWKQDPKFMHAIVMQSRKLLNQDLPAVYSALSNNSKDGSAQHIKILLDHLESLEKAQANTASITFVWKEGEKDDEAGE